MRLLWALLALSFLFTLPAYAAQPWFTVQSWTLDNGLHVVVLPSHRAPIVRVNVWYKTGGASDLVGKSGTAHYLEHLMFRGNDTLKDGAYSAAIKDWGGQENAFTALDVTTYFATIPADKLAPLLKMEASRMRQAKPSAIDATTEHQVIQQERFQTVESDPNRIFSEGLNARFYPDFVYGRPIIGTPAEIKALTRADAMAFHDTWYGPDNAILVIAGDVDVEKIRALVNRYFGSLKPINPPEHDYLHRTAPVLKKSDTVQKCDARIQQPLLGLSWPLPSAEYALQDSLTAQVLAYILDGGSTSPLYKRLVEREKRVTALSFGYNDSLRAAGNIDLDYWPAPNQTDYAALDAHVRQTLRDVIVNNISEADLHRALEQLKLRFELASDEPIGLASQIGYQLALGDTLEQIEAAPLLLDAVTLADVKRFAARYLFNLERGYLTSRLLPVGDRACVK